MEQELKELKDQVENLIEQYVVGELHFSKSLCFNPTYRAWNWRRGSAAIEVFLQDVEAGKHKRCFLRIFSRLMKTPDKNQNAYYRKLLEMNDELLGVKLTIGPDNFAYATFERDINGIEYEELKTAISDVEWWADQLDNMLLEEFGE